MHVRIIQHHRLLRAGSTVLVIHVACELAQRHARNQRQYLLVSHPPQAIRESLTMRIVGPAESHELPVKLFKTVHILQCAESLQEKPSFGGPRFNTLRSLAELGHLLVSTVKAMLKAVSGR